MTTLQKADLEQAGYLGLNEILICTGFKVNFNLIGQAYSIDFYYSKAVEGLNETREQTGTFIKTFTDQDLRPVINPQTGLPVMEIIQVQSQDQDGNLLFENDEVTPVMEEKEQVKMVGTVSFWMATIGAAYVLPDLQVTLNSRSAEHKK